MRSSEHARGAAGSAHLLSLVAAIGSAWSAAAGAQQPVQGLAVERFYPSAAGGGWFVMGDLGWEGELGGAMALSTGYAHAPLTVATPGSTQRLAVVSDQAFVSLGFAATYDRFRLYLDLSSPLVIAGESGDAGAYRFTAPTVDLGSNPDTVSDARVGVDARVFGEPGGRLRLGLSAQLIVPSGSRADYDTDGTYRGMIRLLAAGDVGGFTYAAQIGVHLRPLDASPAPGSPRGSELLFGVAGGAKVALGSRWSAVVGPEIYGETALRSLLGADTTGIEGLLGVRFESRGEGPQLRIKVGAGAGLDPRFGAPAWRIVVAGEIFGHR